MTRPPSTATTTQALLLVAIDGPGGSGKSTVARALAVRLGAAYVDTGATYRALTLVALRAGLIPGGVLGDEAALTRLARELAGGRLVLGTDPQTRQLTVDGQDIVADIRQPAVNDAVSLVSAVASVRSTLVAWQRRMALSAGRCVLEGRDTGAVVVPEAAPKIWLTADPEVRATRRAAEHRAATDSGAALDRRDRLDATRTVDPMRPATDALILDTTALSVDAVVARLLTLVSADPRGQPTPDTAGSRG